MDRMFSFKSHGHALQAIVLESDENFKGDTTYSQRNRQLRDFCYIPGATATASKVHDISGPLLNAGIRIISFNQSGTGDDEPNRHKSSLARREHEARNAFTMFADHTKPLTVCGASMGGHNAAHMLEHFKVESLILLYAAMYNRNAFNLKFGSGFTECIRQFESWRDSEILDLLERFEGRLLIVHGQKDEVVPMDVVNLFDQYSSRTSEKEIIIIPDCPHRIFPWLKANDPKMHDYVLQKIVEYAL